VNRMASRPGKIPRAAWGSMLVLAALLAAPAGRAQDKSGCSFTLDQAMRSRGDPFTLSIANGPAAVGNTAVTLAARDGQAVRVEKPTYAAANGNIPAKVTGKIASSVALGSYTVDVEFEGMPCSSSDPKQRLSVVPSGNPEIHLEKFEPPHSYESRYVTFENAAAADAQAGSVKSRVAKLVLRGRGFQALPTDNVIFINSVPQSVIPGDCTTAGAADKAVSRQIVAQVVNGQEIDLCMVPVPENGELRVQVALGDQMSEPQIFRVFKYGKTSVALMSGVIAMALALLPLFLLSWVVHSYTISDQAYKLRLFFIDPETDTYSLSKLQFYLWTDAALFSYAYLFISRVLVQNSSWPDIPENLPGVIAVAAGTSISAQFITSSKGSKGAGALQPSFADFITSGGVVAPDRVQMLLWTFLGVGAFIIAALGQSPGEIQTLPTVPERLLYLMGLSSAGYLGGKLARKAGPVINEISVSPTSPDDAIMAAASASAGDAPDFTEAIAAAQPQPAGWGIPTNPHAQAVFTALADAVSAARAAQNTAEFANLLAVLPTLRQRAEAEALAAAQDLSGQPASVQDAAAAQAAAAALQEFCASVTQAIAQSAAFNMREAMEIPRIARTITIRGSNLSAEALLQIDRADLSFRMLMNSDGKHMPEIIAREESTPTFARVMQLSIDPANLEETDLNQVHAWFGTKGAHTFTLTNPDGQMAEMSFPLPPGEGQKAGTTS
jgi:hypothetical protein